MTGALVTGRLVRSSTHDLSILQDGVGKSAVYVKKADLLAYTKLGARVEIRLPKEKAAALGLEFTE